MNIFNKMFILKELSSYSLVSIFRKISNRPAPLPYPIPIGWKMLGLPKIEFLFEIFSETTEWKQGFIATNKN